MEAQGHPAPSLLDVDVDRRGVVDDLAGEILQHVEGDRAAGPSGRRNAGRVVRGGLGERALVRHLVAAALNSSQAPEICNSFWTVSVG